MSTPDGTHRLGEVERRLGEFDGVVPVLARELASDIAELTGCVDAIGRELRAVMDRLAPGAAHDPWLRRLDSGEDRG